MSPLQAARGWWARAALLRSLGDDRRLRRPRLLWALARVPRHRFLPEVSAAEAWADQAVELSDGQTATCPRLVALTLAALDLRPGARVLEIGAGCGYQAAVIAALGCEVWSLERVPRLAARADRALHGLGFGRARVLLRDGFEGLAEAAPFDAVVLGCAPRELPAALLSQLADGGRLVGPEGAADGLQVLVRITRRGARFDRDELRGAWFVPMVPGVAAGDAGC